MRVEAWFGWGIVALGMVCFGYLVLAETQRDLPATRVYARLCPRADLTARDCAAARSRPGRKVIGEDAPEG